MENIKKIQMIDFCVLIPVSTLLHIMIFLLIELFQFIKLIIIKIRFTFPNSVQVYLALLVTIEIK